MYFFKRLQPGKRDSILECVCFTELDHDTIFKIYE